MRMRRRHPPMSGRGQVVEREQRELGIGTWFSDEQPPLVQDPARPAIG